jgi:hypothetical protein
MVPFVGCEADGQAGPQGAPSGRPVQLSISPKDAARLAYYESGLGRGVIGPRYWHCFQTYGSSGGALIVSPEPIDRKTVFSLRNDGLVGPVIELVYYNGGTSGRMSVAGLIARVFPSRMAFVREVVEMFPFLSNDFPPGPYPGDRLTYKGDDIVEYETPAQTDGLGTHSKMLKKSTAPIRGVVMLVDSTPDSYFLSVRLPSGMTDLAPMIIQQVERDAAKAP